MKTQNQYVILGMFHSGMIRVKPEIGQICNKQGSEYKGAILNGYIQHQFKLQDYQIGVFAHCIVYLWVYGAYQHDLVIDHKDHIRDHNSIHNLRAITQKENLIHLPDRMIGENSHKYARVPLDARYDILRRIRQGESQLSLAKEYIITRQTIARIVIEEWNKYEQQDKSKWLDYTIKRKRP